MKIFTTKEIKAIDEYTVEKDGITSIDLMERAASAVACEIISRWRPNRRFVIFAGPGNNGGDALAVARMLKDQGYRIEVFLFNIPSTTLSDGCRANRDRLVAMGDVDFTEVVNGLFDPPALGADDIIIDGLFGSGLREPLKGGFTSLVQYINDSESFKVSIDVPSGMFGEWNVNNDRRNIIRANLTLAFQFKRLAFFFAENAEFLGECKVLDIELSQEAMRKIRTSYYLVENHEVKSVMRKRMDHSNKYDYGSLMLVCGSYGMMGAALLSARGAMRTGVGLVSVHSPRCGFDILQIGAPEVIFDADKNDIVTTEIRLKHNYNAVAIGPGMGVDEHTIDAIGVFLKNNNQPCVIDADALNCIAARPILLNSIPPQSVLTPHAAEFDRLFGPHASEEQRLHKALEVAKYYKVTIVLKAHHTMVVSPEGKVYINSTGNSGMATAGSGDVLTGIIGAFAAQGYKMHISAVMGVFIHGAAGDMAAMTNGTYGMIASDIVHNVGRAIGSVLNN